MSSFRVMQNITNCLLKLSSVAPSAKREGPSSHFQEGNPKDRRAVTEKEYKCVSPSASVYWKERTAGAASWPPLGVGSRVTRCKLRNS